MNEPEIKANEEQILYANLLEKGMLVGLVLLFITFAIYLLRILEPVIPLAKVSNYWNLSVSKYLSAINAEYLNMAHPPTGWAWVSLIGKGDFVNFTGVVVLSGITILCYAAIVPILFKKGDTAYAIIAIAEVLVLGLAASGLLTVGH